MIGVKNILIETIVKTIAMFKFKHRLRLVMFVTIPKNGPVLQLPKILKKRKNPYKRQKFQKWPIFPFLVEFCLGWKFFIGGHPEPTEAI